MGGALVAMPLGKQSRLVMKSFCQSIIVLVLFLFYHGCDDHSVDNVVENFVLTIDFQGGFDHDQVRILLDGDFALAKNLTTNPVTSIAYEFVQTVTNNQIHLQIFFNEKMSLDTNLVITDSLFSGAIYDRLNKKLLYSILDHKPVYEQQFINDLTKLEITILSVYGYASFFPEHPPDPIGIRVVMTFKNLAEYQILDGIEFNEGKIYSSMGEFIGNFYLTPWPEVNVYPLHTDTITVVKILEDNLPFEAPCYEYFYVTYYVEDKYQNRKFFQTDSTFFGCDS